MRGACDLREKAAQHIASLAKVKVVRLALPRRCLGSALDCPVCESHSIKILASLKLHAYLQKHHAHGHGAVDLLLGGLYRVRV